MKRLRISDTVIDRAMREEREKRPDCEIECNSFAITNNCCACARAVAARLLPSTL